MKIIKNLWLFCKKCFTPTYSYTLDNTIDYTNVDYWLFKEYGTHTFVKKYWRDLVNSDFLQQVNPRDIAFIAEAEAIKKHKYHRFTIIEEKRSGLWTLTRGEHQITMSGKEFIRDRELIDNTDALDASKIAYQTGIQQGREISIKISTKPIPDRIKKRHPLTLVK